MEAEAKRSHNLRFNFDLVMAEITRWPLVTFAFLVISTAEFTLLPGQPDFIARMSAEDKSLLLGGSLFGFLGAKAILLLSIFPLVRNAPFHGSYLLSSLISCVPFLVLLVAGALTSQDGLIPAFVMVPIGYVASAVISAAYIRVSHGVIMAHQDQWNANFDKLKAFLRGQKSPPA